MNSIQKEFSRVQQFSNTTIYTSEYIRIIDFQCDGHRSFTSKEELSGYICFGFIRMGNFRFHSFRNAADVYSSHILIEKPECTYRLTHTGDTCNANTFFIFSHDFYEMLKEKPNFKRSVFYNNTNILSLLILATPELEWLHYSIWQKIHQKEISRLEIDSMVMELLNMVIDNLSFHAIGNELLRAQERYHLSTIERAKEYILKNHQKYFPCRTGEVLLCKPFSFLPHIQATQLFLAISVFTKPAVKKCRNATENDYALNN
jgi:AraC family transcriptional regulator